MTSAAATPSTATSSTTTARPSAVPSGAVVVTGANGFVGSRVCCELAARGVPVCAVVRRAGAAPVADGITETVGDFADPACAAEVVAGARALVTTVHALGATEAVQQAVAVEGTSVIARAAAEAGVGVHVHLSTAGVYDRSAGVGDVDESADLTDDNAYARTKRDTDAALAEVGGTTRVLVRPPAILGPGDTSVWNTITPKRVAADADARTAPPDKTFAWVHVDDVARFVADLATGVIAPDPTGERGPVPNGCTPVNLAAPAATQRDYLGAVCDPLGVDPVWLDEPAWTGAVVADRARGWGWAPQVDLTTALTELRDGLPAEPDA